MVSSRHGGASIAQLSGIYLGKTALYIMRGFSVLLLLLTGTVFVTSPAALIARLTPEKLNSTFWIVVILVYYLLATILPIDKLIGKLYPLFGIVLIVMAVGIAGGIMFFSEYHIPEISFQNLHPKNLPAFPFMFITVACGAISGFHATQSPMIAKCITTEKVGRRVFYGAMIMESVIALVWAAAGVAFYGTTQILNDTITELGQSGTVYEISKSLLGNIGGALAVIGVVICPVTSGDTAFRSARLILAEWTGISQKEIRHRLYLAVPLLAVGAVLTQLDFNVLWRYFSWSNQTLAMIALWTATAYLMKHGKLKYGSLLTAFPAIFMSAVSMTYILMADEGFQLSGTIAYSSGIIFAMMCGGFYAFKLKNINK